MIDMFDDGFMGDDGIIDDMGQDNLSIDDFSDDTLLDNDSPDLGDSSMGADDLAFSGDGLDMNNNDEIGVGDIDGSGHITQTTNFTCDVVSQEMILKDFGIDVSEAQLVSDAYEHGWLTQDGTLPEDMGKLLNYYGVDTHYGHGIDAMMSELVEGHKVIVGVDAGELWKTDSIFEDLFQGEQADHAIVVKDIKTDVLGEQIVVVNDPGDPLGGGKEYLVDDFLNAFKDSGCTYIATDNTPS